MFWEEKNDGVLLRVRLTPNAACRGFKGLFVTAAGETCLKVSVISVPEKGKANKELSLLLAEYLKLPKTAVEVVSGETSHYKKVLLKGEVAQIVATLRELEKEQR